MFKPLFDVTANPRKNLVLERLLKDVSGFDSVEDESKVDQRLKRVITPEMWTDEQNPPYFYYSYYFWRSISVLNYMRSLRGLVPFSFRPHSGEGGNCEHMVSSFLIASGVSHGIVLPQLPGLEYLYYLCKIGISISPLSNNGVVMDYKDNPFPDFFRRGLNVALSTDAPLLFHFTARPLLEEYAIASRVRPAAIATLIYFTHILFYSRSFGNYPSQTSQSCSGTASSRAGSARTRRLRGSGPTT